jgi:hypothetical protein
MTYMDWTYKLFGIDLSYVWDPELWVRFREAVVADTPALFWNKLWDRWAGRRAGQEEGGGLRPCRVRARCLALAAIGRRAP